MWENVRQTIAAAFRDCAASWRTLVLTDLAYKTISFALLTPMTALFLRWLLKHTGSRVAADVEIARFFLTTPEGAVAIIVGGAILVTITALESGCLMAVGLATERGAHLNARGALLFTARRAVAILRLALNIVLRLIVLVVPFVLAIGLVYFAFLRGHDINYFLSQKPPEFMLAATLAALVVAALAVVLIWTITRWTLALPIVLFEDVLPVLAISRSAARSKGHRLLILVVLAGWAIGAVALAGGSAWLIEAIARVGAPHFADSLIGLMLFLTFIVILWATLTLGVAVANSVFFSLLIVRLWLHAGAPVDVRVPENEQLHETDRKAWSRRWAIAATATAILAALGVTLVVFLVTRGNEPVLVIAHRGASIAAPENTLAAFRLALDEQADFVELDVQESLDGEVIVAHDSDLMKVANEPKRIWEQTAAELRAIDIGSYKGEAFRNERVPTLAEALALCRGRAKVMIELKSYGHNQNLEEKVAAIVEAAGMQNQAVYMSLDHGMVAKMKQLRPSWTVGVLAAKAVGDSTTLPGDFLAVEARMANARFIRRAHRAGKDVYVWTVDDPAWMLAALSRGADGLITNKPAVAREVVARRAKMSDSQRMLAALLLRAGARTEALEAENALRP